MRRKSIVNLNGIAIQYMREVTTWLGDKEKSANTKKQKLLISLRPQPLLNNNQTPPQIICILSSRAISPNVIAYVHIDQRRIPGGEELPEGRVLFKYRV